MLQSMLGSIVEKLPQWFLRMVHVMRRTRQLFEMINILDEGYNFKVHSQAQY